MSSNLKEGRLSVDDLLSLMIFGIRTVAPSLYDMYELNVVAWLGSDVFPVRYEDLVAHAGNVGDPAAETYFEALLGACGIRPFRTTGGRGSLSAPTGGKAEPRAKTSPGSRSTCPNRYLKSIAAWSISPHRACAPCSAMRTLNR